MTTAIEILRGARSVVIQDYPSKEIPEALTRAGLAVTIYGGPDEADVVASELVDGDVVSRPVGRWPEAADPALRLPPPVRDRRHSGRRPADGGADHLASAQHREQ